MQLHGALAGGRVSFSTHLRPRKSAAGRLARKQSTSAVFPQRPHTAACEGRMAEGVPSRWVVPRSSASGTSGWRATKRHRRKRHASDETVDATSIALVSASWAGQQCCRRRRAFAETVLQQPAVRGRRCRQTTASAAVSVVCPAGAVQPDDMVIVAGVAHGERRCCHGHNAHYPVSCITSLQATLAPVYSD